jgi:hypothetical protein
MGRVIARLLPALLVALVLALTACGGSAGPNVDEADSETTEAAEIPGGADPEEARVIDEWSTALREGDVEAAADLWQIPSFAQNGPPGLQLTSREDVIAFNESLPCGAELLEAETTGEYTIATFELTERPGPGECGEGVGNTAKTAFGISDDGEIERWIRVVDSDDQPPLAPDEGPVV